MIRSLMIGLFGSLALLLPASAQVTYSRDVAPIVQAKCQQCHRDGDIAPFVMNGYDDAVTWTEDIKRTILDGTMPPWKPVRGYGDFRGSYALTDDEKQTILSWIDDGTPQGDPSDLPPAVDRSGEWPLGDPDSVLAMPEAYTPFRGKDIYRCFVLPTGLNANQYLSAVDVLPGNRQIVHHVLLFIDTNGEAAKLEGQDGYPGYSCFGGPGITLSVENITSSLGGWAPGQRARFLPEGIGMLLPAKAQIIMQVHYYPIGRTGPDQTKVGLYFSKGQVDKRLYTIPVVNTSFTIPPGAESYAVNASLPLPVGAKAIWIYPHMHLLGRKIKVDLQQLGQAPKPMIYEDNWDFNWQGSYTYVEPMPIPAFSTVRLTCTFDNSANNPKNPNNPLVPVSWGERTTDEMCLAFLGVTLDQDLPKFFLNRP